jgi:outer membrane protein W
MQTTFRLSLLTTCLLANAAVMPNAHAVQAGDLLVYVRLINIDPTDGGDNVTSS